MATARLFIGIDDTDFGDSIGTGGLARELQLKLERDLGAEPRGVTRHQLFVHPDIPYTSHNSSACIEVACDADVEAISTLCKDFLTYLFHPGADPGLCIAREGAVPAAVVDFARRAQTSIVTEAEAFALAASAGFGLWALGGTGLGIIGSLCAVGLRMDGNDGKFLSLSGIRMLPETLTVATVLEATPIARVIEVSGRELNREITLDAQRGVRPTLIGGAPVLVVEIRGQAYCTFGNKKDER